MISKGTKVDLEPCLTTPMTMTSYADEILFIADNGNKKLAEVRVKRADFKPECNLRTVMNLKERVNPTGLCVVEGQQKLLLADSGTSGGLVVLNLKTEVPCAAKFTEWVWIVIQSFSQTPHHTRWNGFLLSICPRWQERSGEGGHNNWWWYEWSRGQVHRCSKSVPPNRDNFWEGNNIFRWHRRQKC